MRYILQPYTDRNTKPHSYCVADTGPTSTPRPYYTGALAGVARITQQLDGGTGFFLTPTLVITNAHVVARESGTMYGSVWVHPANGGRYPGKRAGTHDSLDMAYPRLQVAPEGVQPLLVGRAFKGEAVKLVGYPLEDGMRVIGPRLSEGRILSIGALEWRSNAPVLPGFSGGPMLDSKGHVVGITAWGSFHEGRSEAILIDAVVRDLRRKGLFE